MMKLLEDKDRKEEGMTREEAIRRMECCRNFLANNYSDMGEPNITAFNMAIKALEQEPCEDAVSRQALIERINNAEENFKADNMESIASDDGNPFVDGVLSGVFNIREMVAQAPSVTPTTCIAKVTFDNDELKKIVDEKVKEMVVERKKGKWIAEYDKSDGHFRTYHCSNCENLQGYTSNFCEECGSENREVEE